jgi:large subunit ribosomal protein L29
MKAADLREKSVDDLHELKKTLARDVFQNRLKNFTNRLDDTSAMRKTRRDLARVVTLLHERDSGLERKPAAPVDAPAEAPAAKAKPAAKKPAAPPAEAAPSEAATAQAKAEKPAKKKSSAKAKQGSEAK